MSEEPTPRKRRWPWLWIALIVSLALNLAVVAAVVTHNFKDRHRHRITGPGFTQILPRAFFRELDKDRRDELVLDLKQYRREFRGIRKQLRQNARDIADALRAEPYSEQAVLDALQAYDNTATGMVDRGRDIATDFFAKLTPEERLKIADQIERKTMSRRQWRRLQRERGN